jgi:superfamily II DNA/RNA helicase
MKAEDYVHRIGRTGRAGRNGLAVTLAERMDVGMIRRIQQFTTQSIPVVAVEGLEPKLPEPRVHAGRPSSEFVGRPGGKPSFGNGQGRGGFGGHKKPFAMRRDEAGFGRGQSEGFAPRRDATSREVHPSREVPFANRRDGAFVPDKRSTFDGAVPRKAFDRAPSHRSVGAPAFAPRAASGAPSGIGRPAAKGAAFKSQRPRQGGFDR